MAKLDDLLTVKPFPPTVVFGAIEYRIAEHEGAIVFSESISVWNWGKRIIFTTDEDKLCWRVKVETGLDARNELCMASHIVKAYEMVEEYRGKNFSIKLPYGHVAHPL